MYDDNDNEHELVVSVGCLIWMLVFLFLLLTLLFIGWVSIMNK